MGGFLFWFIFILQANLSSLRLMHGFGTNFEFLGFLVFVGCLGYIVAHRTLATEERLQALHQELEIARAIQAATLPRDVPKLAGLQIAARYVPMSEVAGDFYDFLVDDETHLGVLIADVSGHGVPAALIASMLKVAFAGQSQFASDPVRVLTGLNRSLCGKFEEHYVTGAYVFFDLEKKLMRYAGAGHPPIMLASRSANTVRRIEENGTILGLIPDATFTATEVPLRPLDRYLLYTDGVFEAMSPSLEEYSKPRIEKFLAANVTLSTNAFANALLDDVNRWSADPNGRSQDDDITLVVLDFQPSAQAGA
jgi:serine phosphatase RsbU (regulator of sigma subunit)